MESKELSWKFVTASELLSLMPCELHYAYLSAEAAHDDTYLRDGEDTSGRPIVILECGEKESVKFNPPYPVYCERGLFVEITDDNVKGVFIQWREIG